MLLIEKEKSSTVWLFDAFQVGSGDGWLGKTRLAVTRRQAEVYHDAPEVVSRAAGPPAEKVRVMTHQQVFCVLQPVAVSA
jgi:hypothetical protein